MRELGQVLRTKRESLGLSLDDVQERTKIRKRYLIALENGDWSVLPGYVYGRGFVRSYAEILGLDGLDLLKEYADVSQTDDEYESKPRKVRVQKPVTSDEEIPLVNHNVQKTIDEDEKDKTLRRARKEEVRKKKQSHVVHERVPSKATRLLSGRKFNAVSQIAVVVGVLVIIGGSLYALNQGKGSAGMPSGNAVAAGSQNNSSSASQGNVGSNQSSGVLNATDNSTNNATDGNTTNGTSQSQPTGTASIIPAAFQNNTQNYTVVTSNPLTVSLTAVSGACWVKVAADNSVVDSSDMINQGMKKSWTANQTLTIRIGNVSAVQLQVNGQPVQMPQTTNAIDVTFTKQQAKAQ